MSEKDLFKQMMAEYFHDTLERCEHDVINVNISKKQSIICYLTNKYP